MYRRSEKSDCFDYPTEAPAKAGVWGWVKPAYAANGREERRSDLKIRVEEHQHMNIVERDKIEGTTQGPLF